MYLWLAHDDDPELSARLDEVLALGIDLGNPWPSGAFAFWMWKLGRLDAAPEGTADFYAWIITGEYQKAAAYWRTKGIPYEEGLALMHGDEAEQIEAIRIFDDPGATATANKVRHALMDRGTRVTRGRSRATRAAGLTARQAEVLDLLARELTNSEIADELFVSHRTVENHVSAVLMKLDVATREAAVSVARDQGLLGSDVPRRRFVRRRRTARHVRSGRCDRQPASPRLATQQGRDIDARPVVLRPDGGDPIGWAW